MTLESPTPSQPVSGMVTISGWAFSSSPQARTTLRFALDGVEQGTIPCCVDRGDVARQYPTLPQSLRSGFGLLFNFNILSEGMHTVTVVALDDAGSAAQVAERAVSVTRLGGFAFLSALDLQSDTDLDFREDHQEVLIRGATVADKDTGKTQEVNFSLAWQPNTQTLGIVRSENVGEPTEGYQDDDEDGFTEPTDCNDGNDTVYPGANEICDDGIDNDCDGDIDETDKQCGGTGNQQEAIRLALENPPQTVGGIGVLSGWVYTTTPNANINSLRLRIDGNLIGDIPCCSVREDVRAAFPDDQGSLNSGFGAAVNFNNLPSGTHTLTVEAQDNAAVSRTVETQIQSVKLGNADILDQFDLSTASVSTTGATSLFLEDIKIRDKASQQTSQVTVGYMWDESCQCFMPQPGCGNGTVEDGEECDGAALEGRTCASFDFKSGQLSCRPRCDADDEDCELQCIFETKDCRDGPRVYVTNVVSNTVSVIDMGTDKVVKKIHVGKGPRGIAISPNGSVAYVSHFEGNTVSVINLEANTVTATLPVGKGPLGLMFAPDGTEVYVVNALDNSVTVIDAVTQGQEAVIPVGREPQAITITRDGKVAYVTNYADNSITVLDLVAKRASATVLVGKGPNGIAVSPNDETVYVVNYQSDTVSILDRATTRVTDTIQVGIMPTRVSFAPDGEKAYVTNSVAQTISVIDTQERKVETTLQGASGGPTDTPDGIVVATGGARLYVTLFGGGFGRDVLVVSTLSNTEGPLKTIRVGEGPFALAITPSLGSSQ